MNNYRRFKFVKELKKSETEKIPVGSEITVLNDTIYFNGGMITPAIIITLINYLLMR